MVEQGGTTDRAWQTIQRRARSFDIEEEIGKVELLNREYPGVWSDVSMEAIDKTILLSDLGFFK